MEAWSNLTFALLQLMTLHSVNNGKCLTRAFDHIAGRKKSVEFGERKCQIRLAKVARKEEALAVIDKFL